MAGGLSTIERRPDAHAHLEDGEKERNKGREGGLLCLDMRGGALIQAGQLTFSWLKLKNLYGEEFFKEARIMRSTSSTFRWAAAASSRALSFPEPWAGAGAGAGAGAWAVSSLPSALDRSEALEAARRRPTRQSAGAPSPSPRPAGGTSVPVPVPGDPPPAAPAGLASRRRSVFQSTGTPAASRGIGAGARGNCAASNVLRKDRNLGVLAGDGWRGLVGLDVSRRMCTVHFQAGQAPTHDPRPTTHDPRPTTHDPRRAHLEHDVMAQDRYMAQDR